MHSFVSPDHPNGPNDFDTWLKRELNAQTFRYGVEVLPLPEQLYGFALCARHPYFNTVELCWLTLYPVQKP